MFSSVIYILPLFLNLHCFDATARKIHCLYAGDPPEGAPEMFEAVAGQRQVNFSWSPPPVTQRNGVITSYILSCSPSPSSLPQSPSQSGTLTVAGFSPDTSYTCSLVASNSQGSGPAANTSFTTLAVCKNDCMMRITLYTVVQCIIGIGMCVSLNSTFSFTYNLY